MATIAERRLDISRSAANTFMLRGIADTWPNRIAFYEGLLCAWKSEPAMLRETLEAIKALESEIKWCKEIQQSLDFLKD